MLTGTTRRAAAVAAALILTVAATVSAQSAPVVTAPKAHFGFNIGDDYQLATYTQFIAYWQKLDKESDRMKVVEIGKTAEGRPQLMAIIAKATSKTPEDRYATAGAMREDIREYISERSLEFPSEKLRDLLLKIYETERAEMRKQIDQRMKQVALEDEHPSEFSKAVHIPTASAMFGGTSAGLGGMTGHTGSVVQPPVGRGKLFGAALAVALLAGGAGTFVTRLGPSAPPAATPSAADSKPAAAVLKPAPGAQLVNLRISTDPTYAELFLDGAKLEGNPFVGQLAKDSALHRLEAKAPGRRNEARMVRLDQDLNLLLTLQPENVKTPAAPVVAAPAVAVDPAAAAKAAKVREATPATAPAANPSDGFVHKQRDGKTARPIDNADPYAN